MSYRLIITLLSIIAADMNYSSRFLSETNKNRLGRTRKSYGMARPPIYIYA